MPEVSRFYGIMIRFYYRDRPPGHFHAMYGEHEALIEITTGATIRGIYPGPLSISLTAGGSCICKNFKMTGTVRASSFHFYRLLLSNEPNLRSLVDYAY